MIPFFASLWMATKRWRSKRKTDYSKRLPLPNLASPAEIASYVTSKLQYTGDPVLGGLDDYYQHPEYLQYCIENSVRPAVDCDDYSVLAYGLAKNAEDLAPEMNLLLIKDLRAVLRLTFKSLLRLQVPYYPFHEGCFVTVNSTGELFFIDTNGLWSVKSKDEVLKKFEEVWGLSFIFVPTKYPF